MFAMFLQRNDMSLAIRGLRLANVQVELDKLLAVRLRDAGDVRKLFDALKVGPSGLQEVVGWFNRVSFFIIAHGLWIRIPTLIYVNGILMLMGFYGMLTINDGIYTEGFRGDLTTKHESQCTGPRENLTSKPLFLPSKLRLSRKCFLLVV